MKPVVFSDCRVRTFAAYARTITEKALKVFTIVRSGWLKYFFLNFPVYLLSKTNTNQLIF